MSLTKRKRRKRRKMIKTFLSKLLSLMAWILKLETCFTLRLLNPRICSILAMVLTVVWTTTNSSPHVADAARKGLISRKLKVNLIVQIKI